jgi:hypothetical protein
VVRFPVVTVFLFTLPDLFWSSPTSSYHHRYRTEALPFGVDRLDLEVDHSRTFNLVVLRLESLKGGDHLEELGVDGWIILKWILRK